MQWMLKLRLRVFALLVALTILVFGVVGMLSVGVVPAVGAALAIAVTMVNSMTARLDTMTCAGCGVSIESLPAGTHGIACKGCGTVNHPLMRDDVMLAQGGSDTDFNFDESEDDQAA